MAEEYPNFDDTLLDYVRDFVSQESLFWRATGTGLVRHDKPVELLSLLREIERRFNTKIEEWWVMKQEPGAAGAPLHIHNQWDTYIYYPFASDSHLYGPGYDIMPMPGLLVYLPKGTEHAVEDSYVEEGGPDRYSCVFLAYPQSEGEESTETQGQET